MTFAIDSHLVKQQGDDGLSIGIREDTWGLGNERGLLNSKEGHLAIGRRLEQHPRRLVPLHAYTRYPLA